MAERDVAIVSARAGTTRDLLEVSLDLGGFAVRLTDTAGLRDTDDEVEAIGVARARQSIDRADLVVALSDGPAIPIETAAPVLQVRSKCDVDTGSDRRVAISARNGTGLNELTEAIVAAAASAVGDPASVMPMRTRHREIVREVVDTLDGLQALDAPEEILAEELRRAGDRLGMLSGRVGVEDLLDVVFSEFCIGK